MGSASGFGQILARAGAREDVAAVAELPPGVEIETVAFALRVRSEGAADVRSLLPRDSQPVKIFDKSLHVLQLGALRIEVFVAQDERSVGLQSALVGSPEGGSVTKVE